MSDEEFPNLPNALKPCSDDGETGIYIDSWENWKTKKRELFGRCPKCKKAGPSADTQEGAVEAWNAA